MRFKEFLTKQRIWIFVFGVAAFIVALTVANIFGVTSLSSELFVDLAASSVTIIFTALIIDYLNLREQTNRTKNAADLAEDEIRAICFRIKWRLASLFGLDRSDYNRDMISNREEAREFLDAITERADKYLSDLDFDTAEVHPEALALYQQRLERSQNDLEQTLILYEYALSYSLRELILTLRSELQISDRLLSFIDPEAKLNDANQSLIRVSSKSVYEAVEAVLGYGSRTENGKPLHARSSRLAKPPTTDQPA